MKNGMPEKFTVVHLTHTHKLPEEFVQYSSSAQQNRIAFSQFTTAQYILEHIKTSPNTPVLYEGIFEDRTIDFYSKESVARAKEIFPNGIPENFSDLSDLQKVCFIKFGAASILLVLSKIPAIYKVGHEEIKQSISTFFQEQICGKNVNEALDNVFSPENRGFIYKSREEDAILCVKEAKEKCSEKENISSAFLIFGSDHNFKIYCDKENFDYQVVPTITQSYYSDLEDKFDVLEGCNKILLQKFVKQEETIELLESKNQKLKEKLNNLKSIAIPQCNSLVADNDGSETFDDNEHTKKKIKLSNK